MMSRPHPRLFEPGRIGPVAIPNRIVRAGTSECMATPTGGVTDRHVGLYETLARHRVGLIFTGHMFCERRGQYERGQIAIHSDDAIAGLARIAGAVHAQADATAPPDTPRALPRARRLPSRARDPAGRPARLIRRCSAGDQSVGAPTVPNH
jgi:hypothetical protein